MTPQIAKVNGIDLAYQIQGSGPPLVLIMGYRLNSTAWPASFVETMARQFTVITIDNRGTGRSEKPVHGYALANMARDIGALLDELEITRVHLLGYSMGGAIAQEFVRQFPERVASLILCATMCGGPRATYANATVVRIMRDLDGLSPEQVARQIWKVTYAPDYLARNGKSAEEQMRREILLPTPLHAADLQFQAFAEFDGSKALADIRCPTLVLTGDLDQLIPPQNSSMMAKHIPGAELVIVTGAGHRVLWERAQECLHHITGFLAAAGQEPLITVRPEGNQSSISSALSLTIATYMAWPFLLASAASETLAVARQSMMAGSLRRYGDGKPIILVAPPLGGDVMLLPLSVWLRAIGYRPFTTALPFDLDAKARQQSLSRLIRDTAQRLGRKTILFTHSISMAQVLKTAESHGEWISDVIVLDGPDRPHAQGPRTHVIPTGWFILQNITKLPAILRGIEVELIDGDHQKRTPANVELTTQRDVT
jgi:pimeloyl-ACP methyl ester carboxylesterase